MVINEVEERSLREFIQERRDLEGDALDQEVEEAEENVENNLEDLGADDYAIVYLSTTVDQNSQESYVFLVEDGDWLIVTIKE